MLESYGVPYVDHIVLSSRQYNGKVRVKADCRHVVRMSILIESVQALLGLIVPDLDVTVIPARDQVRSVEGRTEVDAVDSCLVTDERVIGT